MRITILLKTCTLLFIFTLNGISQTDKPLVRPVPVEQELASFSDKWSFLKQVVKGKRIVALGESLHGVKEYNESKLEIIKFLHEELGYNVLAIESDLALNYLGNNHRELISDTIFLQRCFTPVWHTQSHLELVRYLKENPKLKLIGFDVVDPETENKALKALQEMLPELSKTEKEILYQYSNTREKNQRLLTAGLRDSFLADNLKWIAEELYPEEKIIISTANAHITRTQNSKYGFMGQILADHYTDNYLAIGFFHSLGNPVHLYRDVFYENDPYWFKENSLQARLLKEKADMLFLDLKAIKRKKKYKWLDEKIWHILQTGKIENQLILSDSFDGIVWIKEVTHPKFVIYSPYHYRHRK